MRLLIVGLGYAGRAIATAARAAGFDVAATSRQPAGAAAVRLLPFGQLATAITDCTHLVITAPPDRAGDPTLHAAGDAIAASTALRWVGYLSTTGVYGDRGGQWVDETSVPAPGSPRSERRLAAEESWRQLAGRRRVDIFRVAGIYGPGRSVLDDLRAGTARHILAPDHAFGRIHRDDIARAVVAAALQPATPGARVFNLCDDAPAPSAEVLQEAARLLGIPAPPPRRLDEAWAEMSPMARWFWAENRRVCAARTKQELAIVWHYPSYREGLRAILAAGG